MTLENINFKIKDVIQFLIYIVTATVFVLTINSKVDNLTIAVDELKNEKKDESGEVKSTNLLIQNELKTLHIRAELNRQNIEIMKIDIQQLKLEYQNR